MTIDKEIYDRALKLYQGRRSAAKVVKLLDDEFKNNEEKKDKSQDVKTPDERTIRRWKNNKLLEKHFEQLSRITKEILGHRRFLENPVTENQKEPEYIIFEGDDKSSYTRKDLSSALEDDIESVLGNDKYEDDRESLLLHLDDESLSSKSIRFDQLVKDDPFQAIILLKTVTEMKKFKGKCPNCKRLH
jgi:hypothetical protein